MFVIKGYFFGIFWQHYFLHFHVDHLDFTEMLVVEIEYARKKIFFNLLEDIDAQVSDH